MDESSRIGHRPGKQDLTPLDFGAVIRRRMTDLDLTPAWLAEAVGLKLLELEKRLAGTTPFTFTELKEAADAFGVPVSLLAEEADVLGTRQARPSVEVTPVELTLATRYGSSTQLTHLREDGYLKAKLQQAGIGKWMTADDGVIVLALGVDDDHDEISIQTGTRGSSDLLEMVRCGLESLRVAEQALARIQLSNRS